jgi:hypothetical protein
MKQETVEEAAEKLYPTKYQSYMDGEIDINYEERKGFINGYNLAKEQDKNKYSEEDLKHAFFSGCQSERQFKPRIKCWEEWFEQFKKK